MIKFVAHKDGRPMIGIGLSRGNCQKLLEGKPIFIDLKVMLMDSKIDVNDATILVFGGETEASMQADLQAKLSPLPKAAIKTHREEN